jgi:hypothetical protein
MEALSRGTRVGLLLDSKRYKRAKNKTPGRKKKE